MINLLSSAFVASWSGVIRIHGLRPTPRPGRPAGIFVANHSSMIDFIVLNQSHPYAVVGQKHSGWVGLMQDHVLCALNPLWFNRGQSKDRREAAALISAHSRNPANNACPLLIFPEGTCVSGRRRAGAQRVGAARMRLAAAGPPPSPRQTPPRLASSRLARDR